MKEPQLKSALLELGTEEIPASYFPEAFEFIRSRSEKFLKEKGVAFSAVRCIGTPRRMSTIIEGIPSRSDSREETFWGPSLKAAKDPAGTWTQAASGFANSKGAKVQDLLVRKKENGAEHVCVVKKHQGIAAEKVLAELFTTIVPAIPFPKRMVWNATGFRFPRPIRNVVCLFGSQVLKISIAGVKSGNKTYGLSHLKPANIKISNAQTYVSALKNQCVLADPDVRKETITKSSAQLAHKVNGRIKEDPALVDEVSWLVEHPVPVLGNFDESFLKLPPEVLITCMKKHQKYFAVFDSKGGLLPHFIAIRNGISEHQDIVRKGYEKVLVARLTDAQFFFSEDSKKPLDKFVAKSAAIQLQEKLGSMKDKTERMKSIGRYLAQQIGSTADTALIDRAAHLSKFDLTTSMVFELPELQGIMGEIYARGHGENPAVAKAIREHYYPISAQGDLPKDELSGIIAIADKIDGLVGSFVIGHLPSGSSDPYGLRRQSAGILRIALQNNWNFSLKELTEFTLTQFGGLPNKQDLLKDILMFLRDRFQLLMSEEGFAVDEVQAVARNNSQPDSEHLKLPQLRRKIAALKKVRGHSDFDAVATAYKRAANILKQARAKSIAFSADGFKQELIKDAAESDLRALVQELESKTKGHLNDAQYEPALRELVSLRQALDKFFEKVMVVDPDAALAANRLSLLAGLESLFKPIADFSLIQNKA